MEEMSNTKKVGRAVLYFHTFAWVLFLTVAYIDKYVVIKMMKIKQRTP